MYKESVLQQEMKLKINDFGGLDNLISFLQKYNKILPAEDQFLFLMMIDYYNSLFSYYVPVEDDFVDYKSSAEDTIELLNRCFKKTQCLPLTFLIDLISTGLQSTYMVKKLA